MFLTYTVLKLIFLQGHHHLPETRGLCLSEEQTVTTVRKLHCCLIVIHHKQCVVLNQRIFFFNVGVEETKDWCRLQVDRHDHRALQAGAPL